MRFEDLEVGQTFTTDVHGVPAGLPVDSPVRAAALAAELWRRSDAGGQFGEAELGQLSTSWSAGPLLREGDAVRLHSTVVRLEPHPDGTCGDVTRWEELRDAEDRVLHTGRSTHRLRADDAAAHRTHRDVGTRPWATALAERLEADPAFTSSVAVWDGTLGLRGGRHEIQLRIYRGRIIEVTPRSPLGATFTFGARDEVWARLLTEADARFGVYLMTGQFEVTGDPYEYLRLTKALELLVDHARDLARTEAPEAVR